MLSSKDVIERTGISRATLNNYIAAGLVPRPQVLPPEPQDGGAPRMGYFPDDTIARIATIQRLKKQGWSLLRILGSLSGQEAPLQPIEAAPEIDRTPLLSTPPAPIRAEAATRDTGPYRPSLSLPDWSTPAFLVDGAFRLEWVNEEARTGALSILSKSPYLSKSVFGQIASTPAEVAEPVVRLLLLAARRRGLNVSALLQDATGDVARLARRLTAEPLGAMGGPVAHVQVPAVACLPQRDVYAVEFSHGVLFSVQPSASAQAPIAPDAPDAAPPRSMHVAVLATRLAQSGDLWARLGVHDYFSLVAEIATAVRDAARRHGGHVLTAARDRTVCHFLPTTDGQHLFAALSAAADVRSTVECVSRRWKASKGWDMDVAVTAGLTEGNAWVVPSSPLLAPRDVVGEAVDDAMQLAASGLAGSLLVSRELIEKLSIRERERVVYGVRAANGNVDQPHVLGAYARLRDLVHRPTAGRRTGALAVTELIALKEA